MQIKSVQAFVKTFDGSVASFVFLRTNVCALGTKGGRGGETFGWFVFAPTRFRLIPSGLLSPDGAEDEEVIPALDSVSYAFKVFSYLMLCYFVIQNNSI